MSNDRFTETTSTGWFSRIGKSIFGVFAGGVLVLVAVGLLWWNEGRSVATSKGLAEGAKMTVEAEATNVDPAKEGKLVHVIGTTTLERPATDSVFGVTGPDLVKLRRNVEVYQWVQETKQTRRNKLGGGEETVTEYLYNKKWDSKLHDSSEFKRPQGHENVKAKVEAAEFTAGTVKLGAYRLPGFLLSQWTNFEAYVLPDLARLPENIGDQATIVDNWLVISKTPDSPVVGDARVRFEAVKTGEASVLARQVKDTFEEYRTQQDTTIGRIASGAQSKDAMYAAAESENTITAWLLRLGGFVAMFVGTGLLFRPLKVLADVVPFAGKIVGAGTGLIAFLISLTGSLTIIALAWVWYRPFVGISLLVIAGAAAYWMKKSLKPKAGAMPPIPAH